VARTGRRPAGSGTREAILTAARAAFGEHGYERATIRGIAERAGVDPALVLHYFTNKQQMFVAAMEFPINPAVIVEQVIAAGPEQAGERLIRLFLGVWDDEQARAPLFAMIRSAVSHEQAAAMLRQFVTEALVSKVASGLGVPHATLRPPLVGSQIVGLVFMRYIVKLEPLASLPPDDVVAVVAPTLQRYLTGDLGLSG
jgi:AcrR family transcriptional regulator